MGRVVKVLLFAIGVSVLFLLFQYQFKSKESFEAWNLPLAGKIIYLDPGHGGPDGGAGDGDALEKNIALEISLILRDYLQQQGALVLMTREKDMDLADPEVKGLSRRKTADLKKRLQLINDSEADLFISIHLNSIPSPRWSGAQTFFLPHLIDNKRVAKFIQEELVSNLENTTREAKLIQNVYLLKHANKPGALVEVGFLSNPTEKALLKQEEYQRKVAESVYKGILRFFTNEPSIE